MTLRPVRFLALVSLFFTGCGSRESIVEAGNISQTLHVASVGEPSELDPHIINAPPDFKIVPMLFEGLVIAHPATLEPEPGVAASWAITPDRRTYTFHLRDHARWSNGDAITSADFLYSWQRALTPALGSPYTFLFSTVKGAADFSAGRTRDFSTVGFRAPDPQTVTITLDQPTPYFLTILANNPVWSPVHRATIEAAGAMSDRGSGWTKPETFVGNGPFQLTQWRPNEIIRIEKSPTYWNADAVRLNAIAYHAYDSSETEERAFRALQLHRTERVPVTKLPNYRPQPDSPLRETEALIARFINFNTARAPFNDARVRRAFALALDRDALAEHVFIKAATPARRIVPYGISGYPTDEDFADNLAGAQALLADAGYPGGAGFPTTELSIESGASNDLPQAIQARWQTGLGVKVEILASETRVHWSNLQKQAYTIAIGGWVADYPDPTSFLDLWKSDSGWNFTGWTSTAFDQALEKAARETDKLTRMQLLRNAESIMIEAMPVVPIAFEKNTTLIHSSVRDFQENAMDRPDYRTVILE
jgi:oligopeptide transport system substrate-binding protein